MNSNRLKLALSIAVLTASLASQAQTAPCPQGTSTTCPANSACVSYTAPTTRELVNGVSAPLAASEIKSYDLSLDGKVVQSSLALSYTYTVPANQTLTTASVWSILTVDTAGQKSAVPTSCTQPKAISGPKSAPAAPIGFTVSGT